MAGMPTKTAVETSVFSKNFPPNHFPIEDPAHLLSVLEITTIGGGGNYIQKEEMAL